MAGTKVGNPWSRATHYEISVLSVVAKGGCVLPHLVVKALLVVCCFFVTSSFSKNCAWKNLNCSMLKQEHKTNSMGTSEGV